MEEELLKIINHYGLLPQLKHFNSEVYELNEAIIQANMYDEFIKADIGVSKHNREYFIKHITEEIVDVLVMLFQFILYYDIKIESDMSEIMTQKIERQLKRIEEEVK